MNLEVLKWLKDINNISKSIDLNTSVKDFLQQNLELKNFTLLNYDTANYSYNVVFTTIAVEDINNIFFFDAEIENDTPFKLNFETTETDVFDKIKIETDDSKYCFLIHENCDNIDKQYLELILENYLTAYKNKILLQYYQNSLVANQYQLDILNELGDLLGNFNLNIVLSKLLENINNIVNSDVGIIFLYDKKEEKLKSKINWGVKEDIILEIKSKYSGKPLIYEAFESKEMKLYENFKETDEIDFPSDKVFINSFLTVPIFTNNENLGVLVLLNFELDESFIDSKLVTLETLIKIAAIGIENSIFFEKSIEQEKVNTQLKIASDIQENLLPKEDLSFEDIKITGFSTPAMNIGGDFFNYLVLEKNVYAFLGDVAGKGIPAALLTTMAMIVIKTTITNDRNLEEIVFRINNIIAEESLGENYFTLGIFDINTENNNVRLVGCSQEILYYSKNENKLNKIESQNLPIGMFENVEYFFEDMQFNNGDIFFTFSDGITDAVNPEGDDYGMARLENIILENVEKDAVEIKNAILEDISTFSQNAEQFDDLTIIVIKKK